MKTPRSGGGWKAIGYSLQLFRRVGWLKMWKAMRSHNTCKTCAVGMGGQLGGMVNEAGYFPEVCKKSFQAMASDMQGAIKPEFFEQTSITQLRAMTSHQLETCGRLVTPLYLARGDTHYRPITWDEALSGIAAKLKQAGPERSFFYASGRASNEAGFLLQLFSRLFGTNYVNNCSYYCHQASGVGLGSSLGVGTATVRLDDLEAADLYFLIGANPASNHPRLMRSLMLIRRRGGKVIVVNPAKELGLVNFRVPSDVRSLLFGSEIASQYVQPHIGGDLALMTGIAKEVLERNAHDLDFIEKHTEGFPEFEKQVREIEWDRIEQESGVSRDEIRRMAEAYLQSKNTVFAWCMGITHHLHGVQNVQMIANLALLRGMVGRRGAGVMPIRGHSNVQGMGTVGVTPLLKQAVIERFEQRLRTPVPKSPGLDTMACMEAAHRGEMHFALLLGGNLYGSNPDARYAHEALRKIGTMVQLSTTLNTGHAWGTGEETYILPVLPRDEETQSTTQESMFSYVRISDGGRPRFPDVRSEVSILAELGQRVLDQTGGLDWTELESHSAIRKLIGEIIPELEQLKEVDKTRREFHIPGRAIEEYRFPTPSGRARFHAIPLGVSERNGQLKLMTIRSEGQFNSVVYDEYDLYRGQERRDVILMNRDDIRRLGLEVDQRVRVQSGPREMRYILVREFDVRAGNAIMYYPEANVLVPHTVDPLSKTPGFKTVDITVTPEETSPQTDQSASAVAASR